MSLLGTLFSKIFPAGHPATTSATAAGSPASSSGAAATTSPSPAASPATGGSTPSPAAQPATPGAASAASASRNAPQVDVEAVLNDMAKNNPQKLNWRTSIVDLMKLVGMDSSLGARQQLAHELGYTGNTNDSASMNVWLHSQVMKKIAENGGKVPTDMLR